MKLDRIGPNGGTVVHSQFEPEAYRKRLRLLRKLFGMNQPQFAQLLGIHFKTWNRFESGYIIPREIAFVLVEKIIGLTTDWIWFGKEEGLPLRLAMDLRKLAAQEDALGPPQPTEPEALRVVPGKIGKATPKRRPHSHRASGPAGRPGKRS